MDYSNIDDIFKMLGYRYFFNFRDYTIIYTNDGKVIDNPELAEITEEEFHNFLDLRNKAYTFKRGPNGEVIPVEPQEPIDSSVPPPDYIPPFLIPETKQNAE